MRITLKSQNRFQIQSIIFCVNPTQNNFSQKPTIIRKIKNYLRWFIPGMGVKRWLGLIFVGVSLLGIGFAVFVLDFYRTAPDTWWLPILSTLSLRFMDRTLRAIIFGGIGLTLLLAGIFGLNVTLLAPFKQPGQPSIVDAVMSHRRRQRGPKIVAIGGGHGLSTLLRSLKTYSSNITAVVTVADDGGSSGILRESFGILPPGDIRNCLAALSNDEALLSQLFQYRFSSDVKGLDGHSFGNLFISALAEITGSFESAVEESAKVLSISGQVLPATLHDVKLVADKTQPFSNGSIRIKGESRITQTAGKIRHLWLEPENPPAYPKVIQANLSAEIIIVGPGSLYTSILPPLLVRDIVQAIRASQALKILICNITTQPGETEHYSCRDHIQALEAYTGKEIFDLIICNNNFSYTLPPSTGSAEWVLIDPDLQEEYAIYCTDLVNKKYPWRHDDEKLGKVIIDIYQERTGPLSEKNRL